MCFLCVHVEWRQSNFIALLENLYAIIASICYDDAPSAVDSDITRRLELAVGASAASDGAQAHAVAEAKHLNTVIFGICYHKISLSIECNSKRTAKKPRTAAFGAKSAQT